MKLLKIPKSLQIVTDLKFAIFILIIIAISSSFGSFIEQDESILFYQENYKSDSPIYGFIDWKLITNLELDHIYRAWWFLTLLIILGICLISCTLTRQFPLFKNSKDYIFKQESKSFKNLPFFAINLRFELSKYYKTILCLKSQMSHVLCSKYLNSLFF
jgi:cytochrome c biogenesis protein